MMLNFYILVLTYSIFRSIRGLYRVVSTFNWLIDNKLNITTNTTNCNYNNSYVMKIFKKSDNGSYFRDQVKKQGAIMENCILIDDSKNNCAMFESIGGKAFVTKTEEEVLKTLDTIHAIAKNKWEWQF